MCLFHSERVDPVWQQQRHPSTWAQLESQSGGVSSLPGDLTFPKATGEGVAHAHPRTRP